MAAHHRVDRQAVPPGRVGRGEDSTGDHRQEGGRWQASFLIRYHKAPTAQPVRRRGVLVGVDAGVKHLVTTSVPVLGLTDADGHVPRAKVFDGHLRRLRALDRAVARSRRGSKNHRRLLARRARLHGRIAKTRALSLHAITTTLAGAFDVVAVETLNVRGMTNRKRRLGRCLADASLGELRRQLNYKTTGYGHTLLALDRFFPSSKTCSNCDHVKTKLALSERVFRCEHCGVFLDRDVNAARTIHNEAERLLAQQAEEFQQSVAGLRPETQNADRRRRKTSEAKAGLAAVA